MFGAQVQGGTGARGIRHYRSPSPADIPAANANFIPIGQQQGVHGLYGVGSDVVGSTPYFAPHAGLSVGRGVAFHTGLGSQQPWSHTVSELGRGGGGMVSSLLPHGGGGFTQQGGVGRDERYWDAGQEYRLVRKVASPSHCKGEGEGRSRKTETMTRGTRSKMMGSSCDSSSSRGISEHLFGDKGIVDTWGNWNLSKGIEQHSKVKKRSCDRSVSRGRSKSRNSKKAPSGRRDRSGSKSRSSKKPRSGKRERRGRSVRSSSRETYQSKRNDVSKYKERHDRGKVRNTFHDRVSREEKRLADKRRYEEDRLEQVKRREERVYRDEKMLDEEQRLADIKKEERRVKQLEEERLKRERNLYLREEELLRLKCVRRLGTKRQTRSPSAGRLRERSRSRLIVRNASISSSLSPDARQISKRSIKVPKDEVPERSSASVSPPRFPLRRSPRPPSKRTPDRRTSRSPSVSVSKSVKDRIGPIVSVKTRLGKGKPKHARKQCAYCGKAGHGNSTSERKKYCKAFGLTCWKCLKMNHVDKMCGRSNIVVGPSDEEEVDCTNNNSDERWATVDEIGFTEAPGDDKVKSPVDLDKVVIKKRKVSEFKPHIQ